jgi:hypothetical protein
MFGLGERARLPAAEGLQHRQHRPGTAHNVTRARDDAARGRSLGRAIRSHRAAAALGFPITKLLLGGLKTLNINSSGSSSHREHALIRIGICLLVIF